MVLDIFCVLERNYIFMIEGGKKVRKVLVENSREMLQEAGRIF